MKAKSIYFILLLVVTQLGFSQLAGAQINNVFVSEAFQTIEIEKNKLITYESEVLQQLTVAEYLSKQAKDSLLEVFLLSEKQINSYYNNQVTLLQEQKDISVGFIKRKQTSDSLTSLLAERARLVGIFRTQYAIISNMQLSIENFNEYNRLKNKLKLFPYALNRHFYLAKSENLYQLGKIRDAGIIFYKIKNAADNNMDKELAAERLASIELTMINQTKDELTGEWKHFDRKSACYGQIGYKPVKLHRVVVLDSMNIIISEKGICVLRSTYILQPVFDWYVGNIGFNLYIKATNEIWRLSVNDYSLSKPLSLWVTYPPPDPYTTAQTIDIYEKAERTQPARAVIVKN